MKYCPKPTRSRPVQMPLWLAPRGRKWTKQMGSRSMLSAIQPSMRVAVDAVPQDLTHEAADLPQTQLLELLFRKYFCPLSFAQAGLK